MDYEQLRQKMLATPGSTPGQVDKYLKYLTDRISDKEFDFTSRIEVERLIKGGESRVSVSACQRRKTYTVILYEELYKEGAVSSLLVEYVLSYNINSVDLGEQLKIYYFSTLDDVLDYIGLLAESNGFDAEGGLLFYKSAIILMWVLGQHNIKAILNVRKSDLCTEPYGVLIDGKLRRLTERAWRILDIFAGSDTYLPFPSKRYFKLKESPYLLRSSRSEKLSYHALASAFQDLNNADERVRGGRKIAMDCLVNNGGFERVYQRVQRGEEFYVSMIAEEISTTRAMASGYRSLYEQWHQRYKE